MRTLLIILLTAVGNIPCWSQHEYDVWYFGIKCGLDFRTDPPTLLPEGPWYDFPHTAEGWAVYGDPKTGDPRVICDGKAIYDGTLKKMPNGDGVFGGEGTSAQGAAIVPWPCSENKLIVINTDLFGYLRPSKGSHYSIVDMSLRDGLGDVIEKNIPLNPLTDEHLAIVHYGMGPDYWAILHSQGGNTFYAYHINSKGISPFPVISECGTPLGTGESYGYLKSSPNGRKLAIAAWEDQLVELFDFDPFTGKVSKAVTLFDGTRKGYEIEKPYGICFSPDNSKVYFSFIRRVIQCDLSLPTSEEIVASFEVINDEWIPGDENSSRHWGMALGPDNKIYISAWPLWLSVIEKPNEKGRACEAQNCKFSYRPWLGGWTKVYFGLPNNIEGDSKPIPEVLFSTERLTDTVTSGGIIMPIILNSTVLSSDLRLYLHHDHDLELLSATVRGQELSFATASGESIIEVPARGASDGVQLTWFLNISGDSKHCASINIDSIAFGGNLLSACSPFTQEIELSATCGSKTIATVLGGELPEIIVYPSLVSTSLSLTSSIEMDNVRLELFDQIGKLVQEHIYSLSPTHPTKLDVRSLPNGTYKLSCTYQGRSLTKSFVVQN